MPAPTKPSPLEQWTKRPQFIFDGQPPTLSVFLCEHNHSLTTDEFLRVLALQPGESITLNSAFDGPDAHSELRRVA